MKVVVDLELCQGHSVCLGECPEVFDVVEDEEGGSLELIDEQKSITVQIQSKLKYWQIYTPGDRTRIAVEPMSFCGNMYKIHPQTGG